MGDKLKNFFEWLEKKKDEITIILFIFIFVAFLDILRTEVTTAEAAGFAAVGAFASLGFAALGDALVRLVKKYRNPPEKTQEDFSKVSPETERMKQREVVGGKE